MVELLDSRLLRFPEPLQHGARVRYRLRDHPLHSLVGFVLGVCGRQSATNRSVSNMIRSSNAGIRILHPTSTIAGSNADD